VTYRLGSLARRRWVGTTLPAVLLAASGCGGGAEAPPFSEEERTLPAGYLFRLDSERSDPQEFLVSKEASALHIQTGPAGIVWRPEDVVQSGAFRAEATFVQYGAPVGYREAYGLFVGGLDLDREDQEYTYLLVRTTGDYLVKRRLGETMEILVDWTPHVAVVRVNAEGDEPENALAVEVADGETRFVVNGTTVHSMPTPEARPYGIAGIRANHRLDFRVSTWSLSALATSPDPTTP
jgi:hypothetical protein